MKLRVQDAADRYAELTDGCRYLFPSANHNVNRRQRVKPDPETKPLAEVDHVIEPILSRAAAASY
jgi:hypothetical protein